MKDGYGMEGEKGGLTIFLYASRGPLYILSFAEY